MLSADFLSLSSVNYSINSDPNEQFRFLIETISFAYANQKGLRST